MQMQNMTKASRTGSAVHMQTMGRAKWTPRQYDKLAKESYEMNAVSFRCVKLVAEAAARITFKVTEKDKELTEHPFLKVLKKPNPFQSRFEFLVALYSYVLLAGQSYVEPILLDGNLREMFSLRPDRMSITPGPRGYPVGYTYTVGSQKITWKITGALDSQLPILHIKEFHPTDDHYGLSPVEPAAMSIDVHNQSNIFSKALLDNQARPSGALVYSGGENGESLTDDQYVRLKKELADKYTGSKNAGRPLLLEGGLDWKEMALAPADLQHTENKQQSARDIALAFGVPPQLLGIPGDNTYTNYSQAVRALYRQAVIPLVQHVSEDLSIFFQPTYGEDFMLVPDLDSLEALAEERKELWDRINGSKVMTVDEKRKAKGLEPYKPGTGVGAKIYGPLNEVPLDDVRPEEDGDGGDNTSEGDEE